MFPGLDLYYTDPAQPLTTAGEELLDDISVEDLNHDLSEVCKIPLRRRSDVGCGATQYKNLMTFCTAEKNEKAHRP